MLFRLTRLLFCRHILNYLRTDTLSFDITNELLARDVLREAEFFQLETLAEVIRPHGSFFRHRHFSRGTLLTLSNTFSIQYT
jgi:hypothetical protein